VAYDIRLSNGNPLPLSGLSDGAVDTTSSSLALIGKNYPGYGTFLNENFLHLLENFSSTATPTAPLEGQMWWDALNKVLKVWNGTVWKITTGATSATPANRPIGAQRNVAGDLWYDSSNGQLRVYNGLATGGVDNDGWVVIGPVATATTGDTGAVPAILNDTPGGAAHVIIQFKLSGIVYAIFAKETFSSLLNGFSTIKPGLNYSSTASPTWTLPGVDVNATASTIVQRDGSASITVAAIIAAALTVNGAVTASGATTLSTVAAGGIQSKAIGNVTPGTGAFTTIITTGNVTAANIVATRITANTGYTGAMLTASQPSITGLGNVVNLNTNGTTTHTGITNLTGLAYYNGSEIVTQGGTIIFSSINNTPIGNSIPSTGAFTTLLTSGTSALNTVTASSYQGVIGNVTPASATFTTIQGQIGSATPAAGTFTTVTASSILPTGNLTVNLGSPTAWFTNIYGTAIHAQYADLAERFESDCPYDAGTVVELGGSAEITSAETDLSEKVFGVISTSAAYLMNSGAGNNESHPPVAVQGRVPVKVIGRICKGDRLVSAGNGMARAGARSEISTWNVIGRALEHKYDDGVGVIEAVVKLNS